MFLKFKKNSGQGLLEMVVAISLMIAIVMSVLVLVNANLLGQKESEFQIIAANLAREGIEVVRNIRDANWLAEVNDPTVFWDRNLYNSDPQDITAIIVFDKNYSDGFFRTLDFSVNSINDSNAQIYRQGGMYLQTTGSKEGMISTLFYRLVTLESICLNSLDGQIAIRPQATCEENEKKIGLNIKSQVNWLHQSRPRQTILKSRIYDWKY